MASIVNYIRTTVSPKVYYERAFPGIVWPTTGGEARVRSTLRDGDKTPSLSINPDSGAWYDHGLGEGGNSIVSYHARVNECTTSEAAEQLYHDFVRPVIDDRLVRRWSRSLKATPSLMAYITKERMISPDVVDLMQLGYAGQRITFPVKNEFGLVIDVKQYLIGAKKHGLPKMIHYTSKDDTRPYSATSLYPIGAIDNGSPDEPIFITEGEWDALFLISLGLTAVTTTNGCKSWPTGCEEHFQGREVIIAYDNDHDGQLYAAKLVERLVPVARVIRHLKIPSLPLGNGKRTKDVSEWAKAKPSMRHRDAWLTAAAKSEVMVDNPVTLVEKGGQAPKVSLDQASRPEFYHRQVRVAALVTGKDTAPFLVPKKYRVSCSRECESCPLSESTKPFRERTLDLGSPEVLTLVDQTQSVCRRQLIAYAGMPSGAKCKHSVDIVESGSIEQLILIPSLDDLQSQYVLRPVYYVGHGLRPNRTYEFQGVTTAHPETQHATHLFTSATPVQGEIETFELTDEMRKSLKRFQVPQSKYALSADRLLRHLGNIARWQSRNVTKIYERPDLHMAVDLVFHSVATFKFNGETVKRGMLDVLVLGDTRCGKGYVAEGLIRYYRLGEVASGENCSFAGLIGGCEPVAKRFIIKWGIVPLNNGRLVCVDEASALSEDDFSKMSRVRSEGVAEITKIVREQTPANTRLLWLSNTRSGRHLASYNSGVLAVKELLGANEDISRFDFVLTVASNEVDSEVINSSHTDAVDLTTYPAEICRSLVLWAWSRRSEDVQFTDDAVAAILSEAKQMGKQYSPSIPLVQAENVRYKIAKVSAALAARVFSTDPETSTKLIVNEHHVEAACMLMRQFYAKPSMAYDTYSEAILERTTLEDATEVAKVFETLGDTQTKAIKGLTELQQVTADTLSDFVGGDLMMSKTIISELVLLGCLTRYDRGNWYMKNPAFTAWLKTKRPAHPQANGVSHG